MRTYTSSELSEETLKTLVILNEKYVAEEEWDNMQIALTADEAKRVGDLKSTLHRRNLMVLNESTLWARAIYPMLVLAERGHIQAWRGVPLKATYPTFELEGEADGALAPSLDGKIRPPYLIVHEAKLGLNAPDPQFQLYGEMLAAAWLNWERDYNLEQEIFGCYTVNDSWAFVRGVVSNIETEKPTFTIEFSPDYHGISDAEHIVQLLKFIVAKQLKGLAEPLTKRLAEPLTEDQSILFEEWMEIKIASAVKAIERLENPDELDIEILEMLKAKERTPEQEELYNEWMEIKIASAVKAIERLENPDELDIEILEMLKAVQAQDTQPAPEATAPDTETEATPAGQPTETTEAEDVDEDAEDIEDIHAPAVDTATGLYVDLSENPAHEHVSPLAEPHTLSLVDSPDVSDVQLDVPANAELSEAQRTGAKLMIHATEQADAIDLATGIDLLTNEDKSEPVRQGALNADHTGVGKTRQALGFLRNLRLA